MEEVAAVEGEVPVEEVADLVVVLVEVAVVHAVVVVHVFLVSMIFSFE